MWSFFFLFGLSSSNNHFTDLIENEIFHVVGPTVAEPKIGDQSQHFCGSLRKKMVELYCLLWNSESYAKIILFSIIHFKCK